MNAKELLKLAQGYGFGVVEPPKERYGGVATKTETAGPIKTKGTKRTASGDLVSRAISTNAANLGERRSTPFVYRPPTESYGFQASPPPKHYTPKAKAKPASTQQLGYEPKVKIKATPKQSYSEVSGPPKPSKI